MPLTGALSIASWFYILASGVRVVSDGALVAEKAGVSCGRGGGDWDGAGRDSAVDLADAPGPGRVTVAVSVTERAILLAFGAHGYRRSGGLARRPRSRLSGKRGSLGRVWE